MSAKLGSFKYIVCVQLGVQKCPLFRVAGCLLFMSNVSIELSEWKDSWDF